MAKDGKFGTFSGVYTPSLLTILGVIMYLRLPWILGEGGLWMTLGIIGAAHIVSIATGLSVSSIATDKKVGAGGPYYILSRCFGLPIGGAIGLALFFGMCFAISLHIVGFAESLLSALDVEATKNAIRIAGSATLVGLTAITFVSTSLAIKAQYPILVVVAASIVFIFLGSTSPPAEPHLAASPSSPSFALMFGIFFPAATGFMSGVNISGDLRDPNRSILRGTILAIITALAIYVVLTIYLAYRVDAEQLRKDPEILARISLWGPIIVAGIWAATLSSAIGAILGAPRILQAMAADGITPRALAKGHGPTNDPRRALLLAFVIAEAGILIAELNLIARIIAMVYLAQYCFINLTAAIESWASPDFRPKFRIPKIVSIIGALSSVLLMIQLDLLAMLAATGLMIGLFVFLKRRQLTLESGDTWEGVWSTVVRAGLHRLYQRGGQRRHWRPNVMLFDVEGHAEHAPIREFAMTLASGNGIVTDFALAPPRTDEEAAALPAPTRSTDDDRVGVFDVRIETASPIETVATACQYHGFSGVPPNTLLLPWRQHTSDPDGYVRALAAAAERGLNILLFDQPREAVRSGARRIDIWWSREAGNLAFGVALLRFITRASGWERAAITVLLVGEGGDDDEVLRARAARYLASMRVEAKLRVVQRPPGEDLHDLVCNESRPSDLVLLGLPGDLKALDPASLDRLERVASLPGGIVVLRAAGSFEDVLVAPRTAWPEVGAEVPAVVEVEREPQLQLPAHPELAATVSSIVEHSRGQLGRFHDRIAAAYKVYLTLCAAARELVARRSEALVAASREPDPIKRRRLADRATVAFLAEANTLLTDIEGEGVAALAAVLGELLAGLVAPTAGIPDGLPAVINIERPRADFRPAAEDSLALRGWKRRRRWRWFYRRNIPQAIAIGGLVRREHERIVGDEVTRILDRFRAATHDLIVEVGHILATAEWRVRAQLWRANPEDVAGTIKQLEGGRDDTLRRLDGITAHTHERIAEHRAALSAAGHEAARRLCAMLDRVDAPLAIKAALREHRRRSDLDSLPARAERWRDEQLRLLQRLHLGVRLAAFRDRLTATSVRAIEEVAAAVRASGYRACSELREALARRGASTAHGPDLKEELPYDGAPVVARFAQAVVGLTADLPETVDLLADDALAKLVRGDEAAEVATIEVRPAVQSLIETDLITRLGSGAQQLAEADARAWATARDTAIIAGTQPWETDDDEAPAGDPVRDAIGRLDAELAKLRETETAFVESVLDGLGAVAIATTGDGLCASLEVRAGKRIDRMGRSRVRELAHRGVASVRDVAANVIYRRSAGVVYAQELRTARNRAAEDAIRELASRSGTSSDALAALPLYYRNLFTGQININESFFIGRSHMVRAAAPILAGHRGGLRTALVSGARGAGKTTLCQQLVTTVAAPRTGDGKPNAEPKVATYWVPPPAGAATRSTFRSAFEHALGAQGAPLQIANRLAPGSIVVIDDLDLWWERRPGGLEAIDEILDIVAGTADRVGYVLAGGEPAVRLIDSLRPLSRAMYTRIDCQPLTARSLAQAILARHSSTGLSLRLGNRAGDAIGSLTRARLFDAHFNYAHGNVGYALRSWVSHIDAYADNVITIRMPRPLDWDAIDDLRAEHIAILIELVLHKAVNAEKLARTTGRSIEAIEAALADLCAIGLAVQNRRRVVQINPFVHVPVVAWLERRQLV
jgi:amino acid transporter